MQIKYNEKYKNIDFFFIFYFGEYAIRAVRDQIQDDGCDTPTVLSNANSV